MFTSRAYAVPVQVGWDAPQKLPRDIFRETLERRVNLLNSAQARLQVNDDTQMLFEVAF